MACFKDMIVFDNRVAGIPENKFFQVPQVEFYNKWHNIFHLYFPWRPVDNVYFKGTVGRFLIIDNVKLTFCPITIAIEQIQFNFIKMSLFFDRS